jgi:hypothetical protein
MQIGDRQIAASKLQLDLQTAHDSAPAGRQAVSAGKSLEKSAILTGRIFGYSDGPHENQRLDARSEHD